MVHTMPKLFNMTVQHRRIGMHTQFVCLLVNIQPLLCSTFVMCDLLSYFWMKYFSTSTRHRIQATFFQVFQTIIMRQLCLLEYIVILYGSQAFDMKIRTMSFTTLEKFSIEISILLRYHPPGDVYFCDRLVIIFLDNIHHAIYVHLPSFFTLFYHA